MLYVSQDGQGILQRSTLLQLSKLTCLSDLTLQHCTLDIAGAELAAALAQLKRLEKVSLMGTRWSQQQHEQQQQQRQQQLAQRAAAAAADAEPYADLRAAADAAAAVAAAGTPLEAFLLGLAASLSGNNHWACGRVRGWLHCLILEYQPVGRAEAAALGKLVCLRSLTVAHCGLDDCCAIDILLKLGRRLQWLDLSSNPGLTDACLLVLEHLMPSLPRGFARYCMYDTGVTQEGMQRYVPRK
jgi:hypothetical protein